MAGFGRRSSERAKRQSKCGPNLVEAIEGPNRQTWLGLAEGFGGHGRSAGGPRFLGPYRGAVLGPGASPPGLRLRRSPPAFPSFEFSRMASRPSILLGAWGNQ
jgi:hypothetical protein